MDSVSSEREEVASSSGHKLGQFVGDWFQDEFAKPILQRVADELDLYLDHRQRNRPARGDKIHWKDEDGNTVDFDFVLEVGGTDENLGVPVAFLECFWRRGARHSKDKARDDTGKLVPQRDFRPTARFIGLIASGEFTLPARELVRSRGVDLFYVPKSKIIEAFASRHLRMDYLDKSLEAEKAAIARAFEAAFNADERVNVRDALLNLIGEVTVNGYVSRVRAALSSLPQQIRIIAQKQSESVRFDSLLEVSEFLKDPKFSFNSSAESYVYEITYDDGSEFSRVLTDLSAVQSLHKQVIELSDHMKSV